MYHAIRKFRSTKAIFTLDFQNDAEFVHGCIAGGRHYLHINANGDVEPCVFIHYSNCNIKDTSLLDALKSPIFQAYHDNQPFNENMLRPCPMLENPEILRKLVAETGAKSTDLQSPESAELFAANVINMQPAGKREQISCGMRDRRKRQKKPDADSLLQEYAERMIS